MESDMEKRMDIHILRYSQVKVRQIVLITSNNY